MTWAIRPLVQIYPLNFEGQRTPVQQFGELGQLGIAEFARSSRGLAPPQGLGTSLPGPGDPAAHCSGGDSQGLGRIGLFPTLLHQFPSSESTGFHPYP